MINALNGYSSTILMNVLSSNRDNLEDLSIQLATGKRSQNYSGLGSVVSQSLDLRAQISSISGYRSSIEQAQLQISVMNVAMERFVEIGSDVSGSATATEFSMTSENRSVGQAISETYAREMLGLLDSEVAGNFVFSGTTSETQPTVNFDEILYGISGQEGLVAVTDERILADAGADGRGRLALSTVGSTVTLSEEATDFGYKIDAVTSTLSNATVTGPAGVPPSVDVALTGAPSQGEVLSFTLSLPDGSSEVMRLTGVNGTGDPNEGTFSINGTPSSIATEIETLLAHKIEESVQVEGEAASRIQASLDFFLTSGNGEPKRVVGPDPATATTLDTATAAGKPTVNWYVGDNNANDSRDTAKVLIDNNLQVSYGARANEDSLARQLAYISAFSIPTYDQDSPLDKNRYTVFADSISTKLSSVQQDDVVKTIQTEIAVAHKMMSDADARHITKNSVLQTASDGIVGVNDDEVAAKIMTLKNTIEASYQAASMMYQLTLTNFI
ncbi:Flagellin FlgL [Cohaesibacter sp. ES.047]|uniref:flagellin n=1 Tax=Cohaesibacter sp. ES.047 TaxID=1798205 RepID=UPI000BB8FE27|nr:hypothetical protein [Cohaesibacter sp. ES.047]SNY94287.1 Flagellin FlgL [Cohaesibacter sp. ES.047]